MACVRYRRGRWVIDFYDQDGKRRWHTMPKGSTRKEANEKCGELEKKIRQGTYTPVKALPSFATVADSWLASKEPTIRHSTYEQYKGHLENHLKPYFHGAKINHLNFESVEKFKNDSHKKGTTPPTRRKILINLGAILTYAVKMRYIDYNPAREVEKPKGKSAHSEKDKLVILRPEEIRALLARQVVEPVLWEDSMRNLLDREGIEKFYEIGPGRVLRGLGDMLRLRWHQVRISDPVRRFVVAGLWVARGVTFRPTRIDRVALVIGGCLSLVTVIGGRRGRVVPAGRNPLVRIHRRLPVAAEVHRKSVPDGRWRPGGSRSRVTR